MNKKQGIIIVTLLALIVCMGVLATRLNSPLYTQSGGEKSAISLKSNDKNAKNTSSYFVEAKMARDNKVTQTLQNLKGIMEDKNISQKQKDSTAEQYAALAMSYNYETKIELNLEAKGYENSVCLLNGDKATVIVKGNSNEKLTDKQLREIQTIVVNEAKIKNVEVSVRE